MQCYYHYRYSALGPVWAETRVQSGDWYGSGTLHPGQVLRGSLPLLSPECNVKSPNLRTRNVKVAFNGLWLRFIQCVNGTVCLNFSCILLTAAARLTFYEILNYIMVNLMFF